MKSIVCLGGNTMRTCRFSLVGKANPCASMIVQALKNPSSSCTSPSSSGSSFACHSWGSVADVASAYPFMKFCHNARALLTTYTYQDRVSEPVSEQLSIDQGVLARIFLDFSSLCRL